MVVATREGVDLSGEIQTYENDYKEYVARKAWKKDIQGSGVVKGHVFQNITNCSIIIGPTSRVINE